MNVFRRYSSIQKLTALIAVFAVIALQFVPSPEIAVLQASPLRSEPSDAGAAMRKEYEAYVAKEKKDGEQRLKKIFDAHAQNWRPIEEIAPYWKQGDGFNSTIVVNNTRPREVEITAVVSAADGSVQTKAIKIGPTSSIDVPLAAFTGNQKGDGQIALRYNGEPLEINAVLVMSDPSRSLLLDHPFETAEDYSSNELEGVFFMPSSSTRPEVALANTSDQSLSVDISVWPENQPTSVDEHVVIKPRKTQVLNVRPLLRGSNGLVPIAARVNLKHTGNPGDLRVHGMLQDVNGYSSNMRFLEQTSLGGNKLFSPVLPLNAAVNPVVLLTNTNGSAATTHLQAYYSRNGTPEERALRTVSVPAGGAIHADLSSEIAALPKDASDIGLVIEHYKDGGVLADVLLIDGSGSGVYQVSPKGYLGQHGAHNSHSFPFRVTGNLNTIITIANPSETEEVLYSINLYFEGKVYGARATPLRPGEIRNINIKTLRDQHIPGGRKELLPANLTVGQAELTFYRKRPASASAETTHHSHDSAALGIASATIFDTEGKMAFVTCYPQCNPDNWTIEVANQYYEGTVGDQFSTGITVFNVNNGYRTIEPWSVDWDSGWTPIVSKWDFLIQLDNAGYATLHASVIISGPECDVHCSCVDVFSGVIAIYLWVQSKPSVQVHLNGPSGSDITGSTTNVIIGQQVHLGYTATGGTVTSVSWSVPGTAVWGWNASASSASVVSPNWNAAQPIFYWVDSGSSRTVSVTVTINGISNTASTTFNVVAPTVSLTPTGASDSAIVFFNFPSGQLAVRCGDPASTNPYIPCAKFTFGYTAPSGYSLSDSDFQFIQIWSPSLSRTNASTNAVQNVACSGNDTTYPYTLDNSTQVSDNPVEPVLVGYKAYSRTDSFTMTLMFKPPISSSIWVPVRKVDWSWGFAASSTNGGVNWTFTGKTSPGTLSSAATTNHPIWSQTIGSCLF